MMDFGDAGQVVKPSGRIISNLVFIVMEYVQGGLLFDLCQTMGAMGEDAGRFFLGQMVDSLDYMHNLRCCHRDLKLENILVDSKLNLKIADFGFACYKGIENLKSYRGTMTYMAPEIKESKTYDGTQVDLFSVAVILFIIVQGIFPFKEARKEEFFYNLLMTGQVQTYFEKVNGNGLSADFKDIIVRLFSYDPSKRYNIEELKSHPWLNTPGYNKEATRANLCAQLAAKTTEHPFQQKPVQVKRPANGGGVMI